MKQISNAIESVFVVEDWHNFGIDYDRTLAWFPMFCESSGCLKERCDGRFCSMWKYYLQSCVAAFH